MTEKIIKDLKNIFKSQDIIVPNLTVVENIDDKYVTWTKDSRLDLIALDYYSNPFFDRLIIVANKHLGIDENTWENDVIIRIPYPLETAIERLYADFDRLKQLNLYEA